MFFHKKQFVSAACPAALRDGWGLGRKKCLALFSIFLLLSYLLVVGADMGPKDQLTVRLVNPPEEPYYLDLLWQPELSDGQQLYDNLSETEREELSGALLDRLFAEAPEGWSPALSGGTRAPLWGDLEGRADGSGRVHVFSYVGLPRVCRLILVTGSGKTLISEPFERKVLQRSVTFDCASGVLTQPSAAAALGMSFLLTLLPTLVIEGVLLLLFRFSLQKNWRPFLWVNLSTQTVLTLAVHFVLLASGPLSAHLVRFPMELVILLAETALYRHFLRGGTAARRTAYGIAANLASWLAGYLALGPTYALLVRLC